MWKFGKKSAADPAQQRRELELLDLLAAEEEAEFAASVQAARERAAQRKTEAPVQSSTAIPATDAKEDDMVWEEELDVFRPQQISLTRLLAPLSANGLDLVGLDREIRSGRAVVLVRCHAMKALDAHVKSDLSIELGGLLVGQVYEELPNGPFVVVIEEALPANDGDGTALSFTYTAESWRGMLTRLTGIPSHWTIVGSFHSHPGLGVFLSGTDLATQEDVFPHPWQAAVVVDPVSDKLGMFVGIEGRVCKWALMPDEAVLPQ